MSESLEDQPGLEHGKRLGLFSAQSVVAGAMLGIGIFIAPPVVAKHVTGPGYFLLMWLLGGLAALAGALSVAELGAMMPQAGGDYPYLQRAYGKSIAFAAGWLQMLATFPGSLAAMAVGTATFQFPVLLGPSFAEPVNLGLFAIHGPSFWAATIVIVLTVLNHIGVVLSGRVQIILTTIPLVVFLIASCLVIGEIGLGQAVDWFQQGAAALPPSISDMAQAYLPVYFAYSGWNAAIYIGGEIKNPGRNLPLAVIGGTSMVVVLYLVLCAGFLSVFPLSDLANVGEAGTAAALKMFGTTGVIVVTTLILLAMLGSINGTVLTGSRIAYAMARGGDFAKAAGRLHPKFRTPVVALWVQAALALVLIATNSFEGLLDYASAAMLITGSLTVLSVMILRKKLPNEPRPYRLGLYPIAPLAYAGSSLFVLAILAYNGDFSVWIAFAWFALAMLVYRLMRLR